MTLRSPNAAVFSAILFSALTGRMTSAEDAVLSWNNGDRLHGWLVSAESDRVTWGSSPFADSLTISAAALAEITFPRAELNLSEDSDLFRAGLRNGDVLTGALVSIGPDTVELKHPRSGRVRLHRSAVRRMVRVAGRGYVFHGPRGLAGWRHPVVNSWESPPGWQGERDGRLTTSRPDAVMFRPLEFPGKCAIEVVLSSTRVPSFVMALGSNSDASLKLEMWDRLLVCRSHRDMVSVARFGDDLRRIHLHLFLDSTRNQLQVYSAGGRKLAEINCGESAAEDSDSRPATSGRLEGPGGLSTPGLLFRNGDGDLTVEYLSVTAWDGAEIPGRKSAESRVQLMDGTVRSVQVTGISPDRRTLLVQAGEAAEEILLSDVQELYPAQQAAETDRTDPPENVGSGEDEREPLQENLPRTEPGRTVDSRGLVRCHWEDGGVISGRLQSVQNGNITILTEYADEALTNSLEGMTTLKFAEFPDPGGASAATDRPDRLIHQQGSLRGSLVMESDPVMSVCWRPEGGLNAARVRLSGDIRFVRGRRMSATAIDLAAFPDVIYTTDGDVLPCRIDDCSGDSVTIRSPVSETRRISSHQIRAVELSCVGRPGQAGFGDGRWNPVIGDVDRTDDVLTFRASEAIWHPDILTGEAIRFRLSWDGAVTATMSLQLFTSQAGNFQKGIGVALQCRGQQISVQKQSIDPRRMPFAGNERESGLSLTLRESVADVRITTTHGRLRVFLDEQLVGDFEINPPDKEQRGLLIRANVINWSSGRGAAAGAGERREPAVGGARASERRSVRISEFSVGTVVGASVKQFLDEESRLHTLTVPRFRRIEPPTHVLLGQNADLLRGRLIRVDDTTVEFESRLERIRLERPRVASIVWLSSAGDREPSRGAKIHAADVRSNAEIAPDQATVRVEPPELRSVIGSGYLLTMKAQGLLDGVLRGSSEILGECRVPFDWIAELQPAEGDASDSAGGYSEWVPQMTPDPQWEESEATAADGAATELTGTVAADFELPLPATGSLRLSDYSDRIVVLDFWASWCGPCRQAMPELVDVAAKFDPDKVALIGVNLEETPQEVRDFLGRQELTITSVLDRDGAVARRLRVSGIPHTVVLSPGLVIESVRVGHRPDRAGDLHRTLQSLLDGTWNRLENSRKPNPAGSAADR